MLHTLFRGLTQALKAPQLGSRSGWTGQPTEGSRFDAPRPSGPRARPSLGIGAHRPCHHGRRRELLCAAMLLPHAAAWQPLKVGSQAASGRFLPPTGCSLRSGCDVDHRHVACTHTSTLRGRGRASKLTWVSLGVGKHSATVPPSSARAPCRGPSAWRRCCNLVVLHPLSCSNALADSRSA